MSVAEAQPDLAPLSLLIETVDSEKLATKLNKECEKLQRQQPVLIQVLTSDEDTKHGVEAAKVTELLKVMLEKCPRLEFKGLMTMGKLNDIEGFKVSAKYCQPIYRRCTSSSRKS